MPEQDVDWMLTPLPSGRHGLPREYVVRSQRERLLRAAITVAGTEGYAAMTVSAVILHAGVSRKTFYEQFADREACFLTAYEVVVERALDGMRSAYAASQGSWAERLHAALAWAMSALADHPAEGRVAFVEVLAAGPRGLERRERAVAELGELLRPGYDVAPRGSAIPSSMPQAIAGALSELVGGHVRNGATHRLPALVPDLLFCALAPFVGPVRAAAACVRAHTPAVRAPARA